MTKSARATPGWPDLTVSTVKIEGSGWSYETVLMVLNLDKSYLNGA